jgi:drug/metabolite transporter (DMT)-like permease
MFIASLLMLTPIVWLTDAFVMMPWPMTAPGWAIIAMGLITAIAYGGFYYLVVISGPVFASQCAYLVTLAGVFWGIVIYEESHSAWVWVSLTVMILALVLVHPRANTISH